MLTVPSLALCQRQMAPSQPTWPQGASRQVLCRDSPATSTAAQPDAMRQSRPPVPANQAVINPTPEIHKPSRNQNWNGERPIG